MRFLTVGFLAMYLYAGSTRADPLEQRVIKPDATVDLMARDGAELVNARWKYADARIVRGDDGTARDIEPKAGAAEFDDSAWSAVEPAALTERRGASRLSFGWYRVKLTIPSRVGEFDTAGTTAVFEIVLDDYAEVWVDGQLPLALGQSGGNLIRGFNAPNRVVISRDAKPGQQVQLAIFGANGPLSNPPQNRIWVRSATLDFYKAGRLSASREVETQVVRLDPALDAIISPGAKIEKLADGFGFTEGPVWVRGASATSGPDGALLFSDPNNNTIYRWSPDGQVDVFRSHSGYSGTDIGEYGQPGSNGLALDREGRLTICEHGNRRVTRLERNGDLTVLADRFDGKRLNSPNDLVYRSDGALYFTDPAFGLPKWDKDPRRELPFTGVFVLSTDGKLTRLVDDLKGPNGIAFSPDERFLYVGNWDEARKVVMRYPVNADGTLGQGSVFFELNSAPGDEAIDGVKVDRAGHVYVSGPGGLWVVSPQGKALGTIIGPELPANFAWGDVDGKALYLTARTGLYRIRLNIPGAGPGMAE